ncbi:hypothetical protein ACP275_08G149400 [Erythranthe tilingii]
MASCNIARFIFCMALVALIIFSECVGNSKQQVLDYCYEREDCSSNHKHQPCYTCRYTDDSYDYREQCEDVCFPGKRHRKIVS